MVLLGVLEAEVLITLMHVLLHIMVWSHLVGMIVCEVLIAGFERRVLRLVDVLVLVVLELLVVKVCLLSDISLIS